MFMSMLRVGRGGCVMGEAAPRGWGGGGGSVLAHDNRASRANCTGTGSSVADLQVDVDGPCKTSISHPHPCHVTLVLFYYSQ